MAAVSSIIALPQAERRDLFLQKITDKLYEMSVILHMQLFLSYFTGSTNNNNAVRGSAAVTV